MAYNKKAFVVSNRIAIAREFVVETFHNSSGNLSELAHCTCINNLFIRS